MMKVRGKRIWGLDPVCLGLPGSVLRAESVSAAAAGAAVTE